MTRREQLQIIHKAEERLLDWAREDGIPLHRVEYVVPFVDTDFGIWTWLFFETDEQLAKADAAGWRDRLRQALLNVLRDLGYAPEWLPEVGFTFDSHEHVVRDYEGSYFYRLR